MVTIQELIDSAESNGYDWMAREMETIREHPEMLDDDPSPNMEQINELDVAMIAHFYTGVAFGAAMNERHDYEP